MNPMLIRVVPLGLSLSLLLQVGCADPNTARIVGSVLVDGQPVARGTIAFIAADGTGDSVSAVINNGRYEVSTTNGAKIIQITVPRIVSQRRAFNDPSAPMLDVTEETIPEKYNSNSVLKMDAQPGSNTKDWSIESKSNRS